MNLGVLRTRVACLGPQIFLGGPYGPAFSVFGLLNDNERCFLPSQHSGELTKERFWRVCFRKVDRVGFHGDVGGSAVRTVNCCFCGCCDSECSFIRFFNFDVGVDASCVANHVHNGACCCLGFDYPHVHWGCALLLVGFACAFEFNQRCGHGW